MKKKKRVFPHFEYRECDAFAAYLHEQSLKGWHFKEWRCGLVFEKGEPMEITYVVEVFPKGAESDLKPGEDIQEYAEYCSAAGWKFLDSHQKFCIFKKEKADAVSIVEPEERLHNIWRTEWSKWTISSSVGLGIFGFYLLDFWSFQFQDYIFRNWFLMLLVTLCMLAICTIREAISLRKWKQQKEKELKLYGEAVYERCGRKIIFGRYLFFSLLALQLCAAGNRLENGRTAIALILLAIGMGIISLIVSFWRPLEAENVFFQIVACMILIGGISVFLFFGTEESAYTKEKTESIFGSFVSGDMVSEHAKIHYEISKSNHMWILNKLWNQEEIGYDTAIRCDEMWEAEEAYRSGGGDMYWYYIRYPEEMVVIEFAMETAQEPSGNEIEEIRKTLDLP